ncbi:MAG: Rieske 2Fe-2S domain-containing protein [Microthrixaceae bacterium]|nr:Rieske 2Fe-2S domain-containing protein [Microthrixaceae bacterium]
MGVVLIAIILLVVLAAVMVLATALRRNSDRAIGELSGETLRSDRKARKSQDGQGVPAGRMVEKSAEIERVSAAVVPASKGEVAEFTPPDPETIGVNRRQFLNRSAVTLTAFGTATFGAASMVAYLWPTGSSGFGSKINMGKIADLESAIDGANGFLYKPEARAWVVRYPGAALQKARNVYSDPELAGMEEGLLALYQKCPHLGCRVPECGTSQWFECPCHGSQYNQVGEKKGGPAPRGMDRFAMEVSGGNFVVNTGAIIEGPPIGTNTTGQEAEGPHCIGAATGEH